MQVNNWLWLTKFIQRKMTANEKKNWKKQNQLCLWHDQKNHSFIFLLAKQNENCMCFKGIFKSVSYCIATILFFITLFLYFLLNVSFTMNLFITAFGVSNFINFYVYRWFAARPATISKKNIFCIFFSHFRPFLT